MQPIEVEIPRVGRVDTRLVVQADQCMAQHATQLRAFTATIETFLRHGAPYPSFLSAPNDAAWDLLREDVRTQCQRSDPVLPMHKVSVQPSGWHGMNQMNVFITNLKVPENGKTAYVCCAFSLRL